MRIQLLTFLGGPHTEGARAAVECSLAARGTVAPIEEIDTTSHEAPEPLRGWGSPTILVNGTGVGGESGPSGASCRLYRDANGRPSGLPSEALIVAALQRANVQETNALSV
jgi:hypothetical protein